MQPDNKAVVDQIDALLGRAGLSPGKPMAARDARDNYDYEERAQLATAWVAGIERLAGPNSAYAADARARMKDGGLAAPGTLAALSGILNALRDDYEAGYLVAIEELIHAVLEMAGELLKKKYKDAAAVVAGSVLEEHLRKLAAKSGVAVLVGGLPKKADTLNADLVKAGVYNKLQQKQVTAWLGLRNDAAHGNYSEYGAAQVKQMLDGVQDFLVRYA